MVGEFDWQNTWLGGVAPSRSGQDNVTPRYQPVLGSQGNGEFQSMMEANYRFRAFGLLVQHLFELACNPGLAGYLNVALARTRKPFGTAGKIVIRQKRGEFCIYLLGD